VSIFYWPNICFVLQFLSFVFKKNQNFLLAVLEVHRFPLFALWFERVNELDKAVPHPNSSLFLLECSSYCGHYYYYLVWPAAVWPMNFSVGRLLSADPLIDSIVTGKIKATGGTRSSLMGLPAATELPLKRYGRHHRSVTLISGPYLVSVVIHRPTKRHILGFSCQNEMNDLLEVTFGSCSATGNQLAP
jgi:hypothetical protein